MKLILIGGKMSKLYFKISYKDACILKHALQEKCKFKQEFIDEYYSDKEYYKNMSDEDFNNCPYDIAEEIECHSRYDIEKDNKELEEEKRCLERFTYQLKQKT